MYWKLVVYCYTNFNNLIELLKSNQIFYFFLKKKKNISFWSKIGDFVKWKDDEICR